MAAVIVLSSVVADTSGTAIKMANSVSLFPCQPVAGGISCVVSCLLLALSYGKMRTLKESPYSIPRIRSRSGWPNRSLGSKPEGSLLQNNSPNSLGCAQPLVAALFRAVLASIPCRKGLGDVPRPFAGPPLLAPPVPLVVLPRELLRVLVLVLEDLLSGVQPESVPARDSFL